MKAYPGHTRMIGEFIRGGKQSEITRDRTQNRFLSALRAYKLRGMEKECEQMVSICTDIAFKSLGVPVHVPQEWVDLKIVIKTPMNLDAGLKAACIAITRKNTTNVEIMERYTNSIVHESGRALEDFIPAMLVFNGRSIPLPSPSINEELTREDIVIQAQKEEMIPNADKYTPKPINENQLLRFYHGHPGIDFFLKCGGKYFFIQVSAQELAAHEPFVEKIYQNYEVTDYTPYTLISKCLEIGGEGPLPKENTAEFLDKVYIVYMTTGKVRGPRTSKRPKDCKFIYFNRDNFEQCFERKEVDVLLEAVYKDKDSKKLIKYLNEFRKLKKEIRKQIFRCIKRFANLYCTN
eukprot:TRINITY_DN2480_c2_g1_i1.p2 TRINITY_DN2480_c2_g1~~TRINITY_DN2480_c2_g1_i1.p2  ORF type:complete len:349 (+),score=26.16 TRINITY_DN2480_c2_g1_i1:1376-2422(+)